MSVEVISPIKLASDSSSLSDSDHGYVTPVEQFADDERFSDEKPIQDSATLVVDPELQQKIIQQVEWYFSDDNLLKDSFLMKHINRNKQGYVSLKLVASLRKVKALTKDWQAVLQSLRQSTSLALNSEETKVRRLSPAPQVDYTHVNRTLLLTKYPTDDSTVNDIEKQFGRYGEVSLVRILHPGRAIPLDVKPSRAMHPELGKELCVLVEFENQETAKSACKKYLSQLSWRDEIKVALLGAKKEREVKTKQVADAKKKQKTAANTGPTVTTTAPQSRWLKEDSRSPSPYLSNDITPLSRWTRAQPESRRWNKPRKYLHPDSSSDSGYSRGSSESPNASPEPTKKFFSGSLSTSWRKVHTKDSCVIRSPLGPDGTRGFKSPRVHISVQAC